MGGCLRETQCLKNRQCAIWQAALACQAIRGGVIHRIIHRRGGRSYLMPDMSTSFHVKISSASEITQDFERRVRRHSHSVLFHLNLDRLFKVFDLQLPIASSHIRVSASCGIFEQTVSTAARRSTAASTQSCQPVSRPVPSSLLTEGTCPKYTWGIRHWRQRRDRGASGETAKSLCQAAVLP